ncbi:MAG: enoyl-CoA hydratase-related protein [Acidimicrobiales bacterium]
MDRAELCLYEVTNGVAQLTLNRPERRNGMTGDLELAFFERLGQAAADREVRAIVVTGAGAAFCVGADLSGERGGDAEPLPNSKIPGNYPLGIPKPTIAAINGACAGVGLVHALQCDVRFAARGAKLTTAFARRGLIAEYAISWLLTQIAGRAVALDLLLSARVIDADEALALGLVHRVCEPDQVLAEAAAYAADLAANVSPASMATIKRQINRESFLDNDAALAEAVAVMRESGGGPDAKEGIGSFLQRRPPSFAPLGEGTRYRWMQD